MSDTRAGIGSMSPVVRGAMRQVIIPDDAYPEGTERWTGES
jgi:hypothetical protein